MDIVMNLVQGLGSTAVSSGIFAVNLVKVGGRLYEGHTGGPVEKVVPREVGAGGRSPNRKPIPRKGKTRGWTRSQQRG